MIYLDSSALVKLAIAEPESAGLRHWLGEHPNLVRVSSELTRVEVVRVIWRAAPTALPEGYLVTRRIAEIELTDEVLRRAAAVRPARLSSFDAVQIASALTIREQLTAFVTYDKVLLEAAGQAGLATASPA
ncbi:MAG: type II toxin-antitoxin system VapC family toxin [Streptosporangiales bacterium]